MTTPFVKYLLDMLSDLGDARTRAMFGGHGLYHAGVMIGLVAGGVFYLKVVEQKQETIKMARRAAHAADWAPMNCDYWGTM